MMPWRKSYSASKDAAKGANRVLVIQLGDIAEFVKALAAAKRIREFHVGARITLLTVEEMKPLAEKAPYFDMIETDGRPKEPQASPSTCRSIRRVAL